MLLGQIEGEQGAEDRGARFGVLLHALVFVCGFSLVFSFMGASVGIIGYLVRDVGRWINLGAGLLLILFGIHVTGLLRTVSLWLVRIDKRSGFYVLLWKVSDVVYRLVGGLDTEIHLDYRPSKRGFLSSFGVGMAFAIGWTPCVGFVLGGILSAAFNTSEVTSAMLLLMAYSAGLGTPFLVAAVSLRNARGLISSMRRHSMVVNICSGLGLISFGLLISLDLSPKLAALLGAVPFIDDRFLTSGLGTSLSLGWVLPAILAGLLSFLSPCVLPLVPVYLAHLAGAALMEDGR